MDDREGVSSAPGEFPLEGADSLRHIVWECNMQMQIPLEHVLFLAPILRRMGLVYSEGDTETWQLEE